MSRAELAWHGDVATITMRHGENRFHPDMLVALNAALDEVERRDGPAAAVITGDGKYFSNGLDLDYMSTTAPDEAQRVLADVHRLLARVLCFPVLTLAAVNGHAFAAGAMLALACDERIMRSERGYFCLPEVDLGMTFTAGMNALLTSRLRADTAHEAMLTGRRFSAEEAQVAGVVREVVGIEELPQVAAERAAMLAGKPRAAVGGIKASLYAETISLLERHPGP